jgi:hypothetical protein
MVGLSPEKTHLQKMHATGIFAPISEFLLLGAEREISNQRVTFFGGLLVPLYHFDFLVGEE